MARACVPLCDQCAEGVRVALRVSDLEGVGWVVERREGRWILSPVTAEGEFDTTIEAPAEVVWRLLGKGLTGEQARARATVTGVESWADPFFGALAVMA